MKGANLMERESILMYRSTREMLLDLKREDPEQYLIALEMYMDYAFDGTEPDLSGKPLVMKLFWKAAKPLIDANNKNYINGCKGGAPSESMKGNQNARKKKQTENKPNSNPKQTQNKGNVNVNDNANANAHDNAHVNANDNVNVNIGRNPYVDINTMTITDFDKYDEWNEAHGIVEG